MNFSGLFRPTRERERENVCIAASEHCEPIDEEAFSLSLYLLTDLYYKKSNRCLYMSFIYITYLKSLKQV